ncbi:unnamed protein product [marine sediment metagenome]|uniref:Uncharacterized protein n=1 Tax=marine sediment metagenome TaxID=412755 RepID=X1AFE4_9ZZZZ
MTRRPKDRKTWRRFLGAGHIGNPLEKVSDEPMDFTPPVKKEEKKIGLCVHNAYCNKRIEQGYNCLKPESNICGQIKKFYDKYGEQGNNLGGGS